MRKPALVAFAVLGALWMAAPTAHAQPTASFAETALVPAVPTPDNRFGGRVALDGDTAVVSALSTEEVFVLAGGAGGWTETQVLRPDAPVPDEGFGFSIALREDLLVVGAPFPSPTPSVENGVVYVFERDASGFVQTARLDPPGGQMALRFGWAVAIVDTGEVLVGAPHLGAFSGQVYRYRRDGVGWSLRDTLTPAPMPPGAEFGAAVAVDEDTLLVGAPSYDDPGVMRVGAGGVYVFARSGGWTQTQLLRSSDIDDQDDFGWSVAVRGDLALVGARRDGGSGGEASAGAAYVFENSGGSWAETEKLTAGSRARFAFFGWDVAIGTDVVYVGAPGDFDVSGEPARVYPFARGAAGFTALAPFSAGTPRHEAFGVAVRADEARLIVGEQDRDAAWLYEVSRGCVSGGDCSDTDACTTDRCEGGACVYSPIAGCGVTASDAGPGPTDAGRGDAGSVTPDAAAPDTDGGQPTADAGSGSGDAGCGCRTISWGGEDRGGWLSLLAFAAWWVRRRRTR